jgi:hypothetical protein
MPGVGQGYFTDVHQRLHGAVRGAILRPHNQAVFLVEPGFQAGLRVAAFINPGGYSAQGFSARGLQLSFGDVGGDFGRHGEGIAPVS